MIDAPGPPPHQVTRLLVDWRNGDQAALEQLIPLVHEELRRVARRHMAHERAGHTLQATALVNEAYVRLIDIRQVNWQDRAHFFAMSSRLMRRILVDFARSKGYQKRGGGAQKVSLDEYRADTVRNLDAWYAAFGVKLGQRLYLAPDDRVRVW